MPVPAPSPGTPCRVCSCSRETELGGIILLVVLCLDLLMVNLSRPRSRFTRKFTAFPTPTPLNQVSVNQERGTEVQTEHQ